ncbi:nucleoside-diphosphate kinase [candidate division KSB1 bacterium]|nr:nucleoside-diphosphate kinase [candidate division KSB1 bacterium]
MERTLAILKPDCVRRNLIGKVLDKILENGFRIVALKMVKLTTDTAGAFYAVHKERPFFNDLVKFMSSGACIPLVLEKQNAVTAFRELIGATDPTQAMAGTIRKEFANSKQENIVHGSDSPENAKLEISFFFSNKELVENS